MDRATKLIIVAFGAITLASAVVLTAGTWEILLPMAAGVFVAAAVMASIDRRFIAIVLLFTYIFPVIIKTWHGVYAAGYDVVWMSALFGAIAPDAVRTSWRLPTAWRAALVGWAFILVAGVPIVIWREIDFNAAIPGAMPYAALNGGTTYLAAWILQGASATAIGILWFDWLFGLSEREFGQGVVAPLAVSALMFGLAGTYQFLEDVTFLNPTYFAELGRASATVLDANVAGAVAALWIGGVVLAANRWGRARGAVIAVGMALAWTTVWATGSRSALAFAGFMSLFNLIALVAAHRQTAWKVWVPRVAAASVALLALVAVLARNDLVTLERVQTIVPADSSVSSIRLLASRLWTRDRYGAAANTIIGEFPLVGMGSGCFQNLAFEIAPWANLPPDNAQNWYRQQLAELGVIGSLGWMAWVALFGAFVVGRRVASPLAWSARGMVLGFALVSLVGVPSQSIIAAFTFWTAAFWYVSLAGVPAPALHPLGRRTWMLIIAVPVVYAIGTAELAATRMSMTGRVQYGRPAHTTGLYWPEPDPAGGEFRWGRKIAAAVVDVEKPWLAVSIRVNHFDIQSKPVEALVWVNGRLLIKTRLQNTDPIVRYVQLPKDRKRALIETWVSRVVLPRQLGLPDSREFGLMVKWQFADRPDTDASARSAIDLSTPAR